MPLCPPRLCSAASAHRPPPRLQERFARKNETQLLRSAFDMLDANHDGLIGTDELRAYLEASGHKAKKARLAGLRLLRGHAGVPRARASKCSSSARQ